ncbi:hypothetical protein COMA2_170042 [Candidatus Nitrospira nitrificans]|uniref:Uncharacterized protein n=1 Tax=Candidatus Nitrospira nitrificans TaxID=1742973 RepID=A0A0S4LCD4_9BACT|nr:hypothetical protein COMA2_170042 [Candidatus Nitrospira nitrificans]
MQLHCKTIRGTPSTKAIPRWSKVIGQKQQNGPRVYALFGAMKLADLNNGCHAPEMLLYVELKWPHSLIRSLRIHQDAYSLCSQGTFC